MGDAFDEIKKRLMKRPDPIPGTPEAEAQAKRMADRRERLAGLTGGSLGALGGIFSDTAKREEQKAHDAIEDAKCSPGELVLLTKLRKIEKDIDTLLHLQMMSTLTDVMPLLSKLGEKLVNETKKPDTSENIGSSQTDGDP